VLQNRLCPSRVTIYRRHAWQKSEGSSRFISGLALVMDGGVVMSSRPRWTREVGGLNPIEGAEEAERSATVAYEGRTLAAVGAPGDEVTVRQLRSGRTSGHGYMYVGFKRAAMASWWERRAWARGGGSLRPTDSESSARELDPESGVAGPIDQGEQSRVHHCHSASASGAVESPAGPSTPSTSSAALLVAGLRVDGCRSAPSTPSA